jgi:hypothetical protein
MAGDWIKLEHATADKPEVWRMAALLKISPEEVLGHLIRVWCWADQQCTNVENGNDTIVEVDVDAIDAVAHLHGFAAAMLKVHWLAVDNGNVTFPNLQGFISETAKVRALRNRAQSKYRALKSSDKRRDISPLTPQRGAARKTRSKPKTRKPNGKGNGQHAPRSDTAVQALGVKLGVLPRPGESMEAYRQRVLAEDHRRHSE